MAGTARRSKKKGKGTKPGRRQQRRPDGDNRRLRELAGLGVFALGLFMAALLYAGWWGGLVGGAMEGAARWLFGVLAYLSPPALWITGFYLVFPDAPRGSRSFQVGIGLAVASLFLSAAAGAFGLFGGGGDAAFSAGYMSSHGGLVGELLYRPTTMLIGDVGSTIVAVFLMLAAVFLVSGASVKAVLAAGGRGARRAAAGAQETTRRVSRTLSERQQREDSPPAESASPAPPAVAAAGSAGPIDGAESFPDLFTAAGSGEEAVAATEAGAGSAGPDTATLVLEPEEEPLQEQLFPDEAVAGEGEDADEEAEEYVPPDPEVLRKSGGKAGAEAEGSDRISRVLGETLASFGIEANVVGIVSGPRVTRYELQLAPGIKVSRVTSLKNDIAYALATTDIRILAPIPGKSAVGVEVPNLRPNVVTLGDIYRDFPEGAGPLMVWLGKDIAGKPVYADLAQMPHLLVAGTTGSGKSGSINCMISSILLRCNPDEVKMILIDPKRVELSHFEGIPHLLTPVVTVMKEAANVLANLIDEMESRYAQMQLAKARHLDELNRVRRRRGQKPLPYILLVVDELADLMMVSPAEVEDAIIRLAQKSRAVGIHLVLATQRPSVDVITGMIKANVPSRIAFAVSSQVDSRVILDTTGAESLLGQGDMLFRPLGSSELQRIQGAYITEEEIKLLTDRCKAQRRPDFCPELLESKEEEEEEERLPADEDELLPEAMQLVVASGTASVSFLQRRLRVGYTRAGRLIDMLEKRGVISGYEGSKPRRVLIDEAGLEQLLEQDSGADEEDGETAGGDGFESDGTGPEALGEGEAGDGPDGPFAAPSLEDDEGSGEEGYRI